MTKHRFIAILLAALLSAVGYGQAWISSYEAGLQAARTNHWAQARDAFKQAIANRPDDVSGPTMLPGPPTEPRRWRKGSPYSPNFLAAYSEYRAALEVGDDNDRTSMLKTAAGEFETLLAKGEQSRDTYFFLDLIYTRLGDQTRRSELSSKLEKAGGKTTWKIDEEVIAPQEIAAINAGIGDTTALPRTTTKPIELGAPLVPGTVSVIGTKYALIVGQSTSRLPGGAVSFADQDAQAVRDALVGYAGYAATNVTAIVNASSTQILDAAKALAARVTEGAPVVIYFVGAGVNVDGKDYLAGIDTENPTDTSSMLAKIELYKVFVSKGARVFAFFETNRPTVGDTCFGSEVPIVGSISQAEATRPGEGITSVTHGGQTLGLYTTAFCEVLSYLRTNRVPIQEFSWQVFYTMKSGGPGRPGIGIHQTPTLPILNDLATDSRF